MDATVMARPDIIDRIRRLRANCDKFFAIGSGVEDRPNREITLDGLTFHDIPSFYLAIGEAINGPAGYFGQCLDSLKDCFCGGFGIALPVKITIVNCEAARLNLGFEAQRAWYAALETLNPTSADSAPRALPDPAISYFAKILEVLEGYAQLELREHD
jgi:RNAse (barnase) inhibitor barstar